MRTLRDASTAFDSPARIFGSFRGRLPPLDMTERGRGRLWRFLHHKRWLYLALATDELFAGLAVVDLGYAVSAFAFAFDAGRGELIADRSLLSLPGLSAVRRRGERGWSARFRGRGGRISVEEEVGRRFEIRAYLGDLRIDACLDPEAAPPPIGAIAPIEGGAFNATEKGALMPATGSVVAAGRAFDLAGGHGGYDATAGLLARRTAWRWAYLLGRARSGERVALNLVEGFVGEPECALWIDGELYPLAEGRFAFDAGAPLAPWLVRTADGAVDLRFEPGGLHTETMNLGIIASRFLQPVGRFSGVVARPGGGDLELDRVLGVVEDQDARW